MSFGYSTVYKQYSAAPTQESAFNGTDLEVFRSTRYMRDLTDESESAGKITIAKLGEQHEQKILIAKKQCDINDHIANIKQSSNKSKSVFGRIRNWLHISNDDKKKTTTAPKSRKSDKKCDTYIGKPRNAMNVFECETEDELYDIHQGVRRLSLLATQINDELDSQKLSTDHLLKVTRVGTV